MSKNNSQEKSVWVDNCIVSISFASYDYNVARDSARQIIRAFETSLLGDKWHENHFRFISFVENTNSHNNWTFYLLTENRISSIKLDLAVTAAEFYNEFKISIDWQPIDSAAVCLIHLLLKNVQSGEHPDYDWIIPSKSLLKL